MGKEDAILNSNQLNKVIGMIIPPPETKKIIDKAAALVAKYGKDLEDKMKHDQSPLFSFLKDNDPYNNYYQQRIIQYKDELSKAELEDEKGKEQSEDNSSMNKNQFLNKKRENDTPLPQNQKKGSRLQDELRSLLNLNLSSSSKPSNTSLQNEIKDAKPPKPDQFSISHPNIQSLDMDIIKITAQFVARNGQKFLSELSERESKNPQFNFLKPQHNLFGYFTYLVGSYSKILSDKKEKIKKLVQYSNDKEIILKEANNRVLYEKKIKKMQKSKKFNETDFMTEEEKKKMQVINWYDFVVVDIIDFDDEKEENQKEEEEKEQIEMNQIIKEKEPIKNEENDDIIVENVSPIITPLQVILPPEKPTIYNEKQEEKVNEKSEMNETESINKEESNNKGENEKLNNNENINKPNIKIVKNYTRQPHKATISQKESSEIKCPLCKASVPEEDFQDHIRIELLDPKWKEVQKEISSRQASSTLASTPEFLTYLGNFSKSRPDLFGDIDDIHNFEQKKKLEPSQVPSHQIWNGYNPYMSRTTANITMFKQQNKKHLEESKKAQQMASSSSQQK